MTNSSPVALVHGAGCSIGNEIAINLGGQDIRLVLYDDAAGQDACSATAAALAEKGVHADVLPDTLSNSEIVEQAAKLHGRLDYFFNCTVPGPDTSAKFIHEYPQLLLERDLAAANAMVACGSKGAIVNQWFLGSLFEDTALEAAVVMSKGAITGLTRDICCRFGKSEIRINTLQLGLFDLPETKGLVTDRVLARKTPVGRWGAAAEAAKFMIFLATRNGYMTGQVICFDGGLTAGNTGT